MAYFRPSLQPQLSPKHSGSASDLNINLSKGSSKERPHEYHAPSNRPVVVFSIDVTNWSPAPQYCFLAGGLILFMCLYGYFQELVQYGWFDRKLSLFSTLLHFIGVSVFAQVQRNMSNQPRKGHYSWTSMGTASPRIAFFYYVLLVLVKVMSQGMSNLCMTQINYPAKVLFKSANPIITMIIGVVWFRRTYPLRDYIVVTLLVLGLYIFIVGGAGDGASPTSTALGIVYVIISMFGSAGVPMIQEHCISVYNASVEDLLYHSFLGSAIVSLLLSLVTGELLEGILFLAKNSSAHTWFIFAAFCTFSFYGANFGTALTAQYGALVNGITSTLRKAITLALSFLLFPERNTLSAGKILGAAIFFSGLLFRVFSKVDHREGKESPTRREQEPSPQHRSIPNDFLNMPFDREEASQLQELVDGPAVYLDMEDELMLMNKSLARSYSVDQGQQQADDDLESRLTKRTGAHGNGSAAPQDSIRL